MPPPLTRQSFRGGGRGWLGDAVPRGLGQALRAAAGEDERRSRERGAELERELDGVQAQIRGLAGGLDLDPGAAGGRAVVAL